MVEVKQVKDHNEIVETCDLVLLNNWCQTCKIALKNPQCKKKNPEELVAPETIAHHFAMFN